MGVKLRNDNLNNCLPFSFSLTLIDSLDTLAVSECRELTATHISLSLFLSFLSLFLSSSPSQVLGALDEFSEAIQLVLRDVRYNSDLVVSVFETNIRILG